MKIPKQIVAGDSVSWDDVPGTDNRGNSIDSGLWTLKYDFRQANVTNVTVTATPEGSGWRTSLTKTQTALWAAGKVYFQAYAEKDDERVTLGTGSFDVLQNLTAAANSAEFRSQAKQDLEAVQLAIRSLVSGGVKSYTIGGRSLTKMDLPDLIARESKLKEVVAREEKAQSLANGLGNPHNLLVRFK